MENIKIGSGPIIDSAVFKCGHRDLPKDEVFVVKTQPCDKLHRLNTAVAKTHGLTAAVLYQSFAWYSRHKGKWTGSMEMLLTAFPYMSRMELRLALHKLMGIKKDHPRLIKRIKDGLHFTYTVAEYVQGGSLDTFDPKMAETHGILPAIVYDNVVSKIAHNMEVEGGDEPTHYVSPSEWQKAHPYAPVRSVMRAFRTLREAGELVWVGRKYGRIPIWKVPQGGNRFNRFYKLHHSIMQNVTTNKAAEKGIISKMRI